MVLPLHTHLGEQGVLQQEVEATELPGLEAPTLILLIKKVGDFQACESKGMAFSA